MIRGVRQTTNLTEIDLPGRLLEISHGAIKTKVTSDRGKGQMQVLETITEMREEIVLAPTTIRTKNIEMGDTAMIATVVIQIATAIGNMTIAQTIGTTETINHILSVKNSSTKKWGFQPF